MREHFFLPLDNILLPSNTVTADKSHNSVKGFSATFYDCHICFPKEKHLSHYNVVCSTCAGFD